MVWFRRFLALLSSIVFIWMLLHTANRYLTAPGLSVSQNEFVNRTFTKQIIVANRTYNDLTDGGIQAKVALSNSIFQAGLLVTAGLAGLLIAKDQESGFLLDNRPELIMFIGAISLLLMSFVSHYFYLKEIAYLYFLAGSQGVYRASNPSVPDIADDNVNFLFTYQLEYLASGTILALFTIFSAHKLAPKKTGERK